MAEMHKACLYQGRHVHGLCMTRQACSKLIYNTAGMLKGCVWHGRSFHLTRQACTQLNAYDEFNSNWLLTYVKLLGGKWMTCVKLWCGTPRYKAMWQHWCMSEYTILHCWSTLWCVWGMYELNYWHVCIYRPLLYTCIWLCAHVDVKGCTVINNGLYLTCMAM